MAKVVIFLFFAFGVSLFGFELLMEDNYKPYTYTENGEPKGEYYEKVKRAMKILGEEKTIKAYPFKRAYNMLEATPNTAMFAVVKTPEREALFNWACPVGIAETIMVRRKKPDIKKYKNLDEMIKNGALIGLVNGFSVHKFIEKEGAKNLDISFDRKMLLEKFKAGRFDYMPMGSFNDLKNLEEIGLENGSLEFMFKLYDTVKCIAFSKDIPIAEVKKWENALKKAN